MAVGLAGLAGAAELPMWDLAKAHEKTFRFSTLFTAQAVRRHFQDEQKIDQAIQWCQEHGVTRVFIESFRDGYQAEKEDLVRGRDRFREAGFAVSGCVTPTGMGVASTGWRVVSNYEAPETRAKCRAVFEYAASLFDEIMIDDFLFTEDTSEGSQKAKGDRSWAEYRCELMLRVSREDILAPARAVNPNVKVIIKYPQWYDMFHERGYDVVKQTDAFDRIWVGTETRDPDSRQWGRKAQYEAFYIMQWLTDLGGAKTGGGWFDPYGTSPATYVEQARQTILGGAKEAFLFNYADLIRDENKAKPAALLTEMPALFRLAETVAGAKPVGVLAPKIPNSAPGKEEYIYDFIGMLGVPLVPLGRIDASYPAAVFATQSWEENVFAPQLREFVKAGKPVTLTHHLRDRLKEKNVPVPEAVSILQIPEEPRDLYNLDEAALRRFREPLLKALGLAVEGPTRVAFYMYDNGVWAVENFRDEPGVFTIRLEKPLPENAQARARETFFALPRNESVSLKVDGQSLTFELQPRSLGVAKVGEEK
ncbi:MAG: hypothetical protein ACE15F_10665 [bacterium]